MAVVVLSRNLQKSILAAAFYEAAGTGRLEVALCGVIRLHSFSHETAESGTQSSGYTEPRGCDEEVFSGQSGGLAQDPDLLGRFMPSEPRESGPGRLAA